jgi:hypothetical protein
MAKHTLTNEPADEIAFLFDRRPGTPFVVEPTHAPARIRFLSFALELKQGLRVAGRSVARPNPCVAA